MFKVQQIDHIHVMVEDKFEAAKWYEQTLGLTIVKEKEYWAQGGGPLLISSDHGNTSLALFSRKGPRAEVAFRVGVDGFFEFVAHTKNLDLINSDGEALSQSDIVDHDGAYSIYFDDPSGNLLEVTSYDYDEIKHRLQAWPKG